MSRAAAVDKEFELNLTIDAAVLRGLLEGHVADARSPLSEVVGNAVIISNGGMLSLTTTDLQKQLTRRLAGDWPIGGAAVDARLLGAALKGLDGELTLARAPGKPAVLRAGRRRFNLPAVDPIDIPLINDEQEDVIECDPWELAEAIARVEYAASRKDVRYYLLSVFIEQETVVAADGHRMAWRELRKPLSEDLQAIIPIDAVPRILAVWPGKEDSGAVLRRGPGQLIFHTDEAEIIVKLVDARYPSWRPSVPDLSDRYVEFAAKDLAGSIARVLPFTELALQGGAVKSAASMQIGSDVIELQHPEAQEQIEADTSRSPDDCESVALNLHYLRAVAKGSERIRWHPAAWNVGQVFQPVGQNLEWHLVMPLRP